MGKAIQKANMTDFPEVMAFEQAKSDIEEYKAMHKEVFETFDALVERYNTSLEAADKSCRAAEVNCGPFDLYQYKTTYDAEKFYNAVGRNQFLELGGSTGTKTTYEIDKARFEASVAAKKISKEVVDMVRKESPAYHTPKKAVIP